MRFFYPHFLPAPEKLFRKTLWQVDAQASDVLAVESANMGFVAGQEDLAAVLDGGGEHGAVFFWQDQSEGWSGQGGRAGESGDAL